MNRNEILFDRAKAVIPGGVNSPVRAFGSVGGVPRFIKKAEGAYVWDENGTRYTDYVGSWGPAIVGHAHPEVVEAVREAALGGLSFGAPTEGEIAIAEQIAEIMPSVERLRLVSSGTEATMTAIRLARGFTGRDKIIKFEGCYHGHSDSLLVKAGSGLLTFGNPSSAGVPADFTKHTLVLEYNNIAQLEEAFAQSGDEIACVIVEPFVGNMNLVRPTEAFVKALRGLTEKHGAVLIYDEVMTGFRVALGGAQSLHGITPDLTTMGKVIGGGMPLAAFGGRKDIMECISPLGGVYQAGTLSGNPIAVAAGLKTLEIIQREGFYENLTALTQRLANGIAAAKAHGIEFAAAKAHGIEFAADSVGGMFGLYFAAHVPRNYADMARSNIDAFKRFFHGMLDRGIAFGPSAYEAGFVSAAHTPELIDETVAVAVEVFKAMAA
ncbi:TPA: glutamate-1-semialdehyde 2,1-aminomutase [Neisseria gonorrhoeae]